MTSKVEMPQPAPNEAVKNNLSSPALRKKLIRPLIFFAVLIAVGSALIMTGHRRDADTLAQQKKYGVLTAEDVNVAFEKVSAKLIARPFAEGSSVRKGDLLMALDPTDTDIAIAKTKAQIEQNLASAESERQQIAIDLAAENTAERNAWRTIEAQKAALDAAVSSERRALADYRRAEELVKTSAVSRSQYDSAKSSWENAAAAVSSARKNLAASTVGAPEAAMKKLSATGSAEGMRLSSVADARASIENRKLRVKQLEAAGDELQASLRSLEVEKSRLSLTAPEDGKVVKLLYQPGEVVPAGSPAVLLQSTRQYYEIYVSEKDTEKFREGSEVTGTTAAGAKVRGTVRVLYRAPGFADMRGTREKGQADLTSFIARIYVDPAENAIPGMTVEVKVNG